MFLPYAVASTELSIDIQNILVSYVCQLLGLQRIIGNFSCLLVFLQQRDTLKLQEAYTV